EAERHAVATLNPANPVRHLKSIPGERRDCIIPAAEETRNLESLNKRGFRYSLIHNHAQALKRGDSGSGPALGELPCIAKVPIVQHRRTEGVDLADVRVVNTRFRTIGKGHVI